MRTGINLRMRYLLFFIFGAIIGVAISVVVRDRVRDLKFDVFYASGYNEYSEKNFVAAIENFGKAMGVDANKFFVYEDIAKCYLHLKNKDIAIERMMNFIAHERRDYSESAEYQEQLKKDAASYIEMILDGKLVREEMIRIFPNMKERWPAGEKDTITFHEE